MTLEEVEGAYRAYIMFTNLDIVLLEPNPDAFEENISTSVIAKFIK